MKEILRKLGQHRNIIIILIVAVFVVFLSTAIHKYFISYLPENSSHGFFFYYFTNNTGGIFATLIGLATIFGIYIAILQIREQKSIIINYPQLLELLTKLLKESKKDDIGIVSYFPLPGYWQVSETMSNDFYEHLKACENIKMVCLAKEEHLSILIDVAQKGTLKFAKKDLRRKFQYLYNRSEGLLQQMKYHPTRKNFDALPHYFIFVAKKQAIIVTPTGLPKINSVISDYLKIEGNYQNIVAMISDKKNFNFDDMMKRIQPTMEETQTGGEGTQTILEMEKTKKNNNDDKVLVQTLGFYTTDPSVIQRLWDIHKEYYNESDNQDD